MANLVNRYLTDLGINISVNLIFAVITVSIFCVLCLVSAEDRVVQIEITGTVMDQDGVIQKNIPVKITIYLENADPFEFDNPTNYKGEYAVYYPLYEGKKVKISATATKFGSGGYNEKIYRSGDIKQMDIIMIKNSCPTNMLISGNIKNENDSFISDAYVYLKVYIPVKNSSEMVMNSVNTNKTIKEVIAGSNYTNDDGEYVLVPSVWTVSGDDTDAEIFVTDKDYNILRSEKFKIMCGSNVRKNIVIKEKSTAEDGTISNSNKFNVSSDNTYVNSDNDNSGDNSNNPENSLSIFLISLIMLVGLIILSMILLKYGKRNTNK
ncbi:MAG: hypothetical protein QMD06_01525 [Candidatus Altarchaeum sp.]|nr:hypothetical protein [Candidatus Altarchaeum sp.]